MLRKSLLLQVLFLFPFSLFALDSSFQQRELYQKQRVLLAPDDIEGHIELGYFCYDNGLYKEAMQEFRKVLMSPRISLGSKHEIAKLLEIIEENAAVALFNQAMQAWQMDHHFEAAEEKLKELLALYPMVKIRPQAKRQLQRIKEEKRIKAELAQVEKSLVKKETENFIVFSPTKDLSDEIAEKAELKRRAVIRDLGFSIFPSWKENRAQIYVFSTRDAFEKYASSREWAGGWTLQVLQEDAVGNKAIMERAIYTYQSVPQLIDRVVPHELTHLVFREFFGFSSNLPTWLDEGVATWQEDKNPMAIEAFQGSKKLFEQAIPFEIFLYLQDYPRNPSLFYAQAQSVVQFMIQAYGNQKFIQFLQSLSLNEPLPQALQAAYPNEFLDLKDFELAWKSWLLQQKSLD